MIDCEWPVDRGPADRAAGRRPAAKGMLVARSSRRAAASRTRGAVRIGGDSESISQLGAVVEERAEGLILGAERAGVGRVRRLRDDHAGHLGGEVGALVIGFADRRDLDAATGLDRAELDTRGLEAARRE